MTRNQKRKNHGRNKFAS